MTPFRDLNRRYQHIQRYRQIAEVLIKNGFGFLLEKLDLHQIIPLKNRIKKWDKSPEFATVTGQRLRKTLEELGPTFVKIGQIMSTRPDLLSKEIRKELERLQDQASKVSIDQVKQVICEEVGEPVGKIFAEFSEEPLAAASIGQVHKARLVTGEKVVVKVQRPGINKKLKIDLEIIQHLAELWKDRMEGQTGVDLVRVVDEFASALRLELDYRNEGRNAERFRRNFRNNYQILAPKIYWEFTTQRVLIMEYMDGVKVTQIAEEELKPAERKTLAKRGANSILSQMLEYGFFHGDPHPGNILITEERKIVYLDFGLMGNLDDQSQKDFAQLFIALLRKDTDRVVDTFLNLGLLQDSLDLRAFKREMSGLVERYYGVELENIHIGELMDELLEVGRKYQIQFPYDLILVGKSLVTFEGVGRLLDPSFNVVQETKPFALRLVKKQLHPKQIGKSLTKETENFLKKVKYFPDDMHLFFEKLLSGKLEINFKHQNLESLVSKLDIVVNRLVVGLIVSSLFMGSSFTIQMEMGPKIQGISAIGFVGYLIAGILGIWLVISILRSGRF